MSGGRLNKTAVDDFDSDIDIDATINMLMEKNNNNGSTLGSKVSSLLAKNNSLSRTVYRDNSSAIYPSTVDVTSSAKNEQIVAVATALCPDLLVVSSSSSCSSLLAKRLEEHVVHVDEDEDEEPPSCDDSSEDSGSTADEVAAAETSEEVQKQKRQQQQPLLSVRPLLGGLSNELFVVENDSTGASVLVRIHPDTTCATSATTSAATTAPTTTAPTSGEEKNDIVDRNVESKLVAWLSSLKEAPVFYGRFRNGRVEQFFPSVEPLTPALMHAHAAQIGSLLGRLHTLRVPPSIFPVPGIDTTNNSGTDKLILQGAIWHRVEDWFAMIADASSSKSPLVLGELQREWLWLREAFQRHYSDSTYNKDATQAREFLREVVLAHMDCQSLNLLKACSSSPSSSPSTSKQHLRLIDFEYAGLNPRAADLANTFCEFCSMNAIAADFAAEYPSAATQNVFLRAYCRATATAAALPKLAQPSHNGDAAFLAAMRLEIGRYTVLSHLQWAVWSLVQERNRGAATGFDYAAYARHRMQGYRHHKRLFWGTD